MLRCVGKTHAQNLEACETIFGQFRNKGYSIHVLSSVDTFTKYKGKLTVPPTSFEKFAKEISELSEGNFFSRTKTGVDMLVITLRPKVLWDTRTHKYFFEKIYESFRTAVKTLLLINQRLKICKDIILNVLIPMLSEMEQDDAFGKPAQHQGCYIYTDGSVQATNIRNPAALHEYFDRIKLIAGRL